LDIFLKGKELWGYIDDNDEGDLTVEGSTIVKAT